MTTENTINQAETIAIRREETYLGVLTDRVNRSQATQEDVDKLCDEIARLKEKGHWDEEEQIIGNLERKKK